MKLKRIEKGKEKKEDYTEAIDNNLKGQTIVPSNTFEWYKEAYLIYRTIEINKHLIWATWVLAISTIILSGLTLFLK